MRLWFNKWRVIRHIREAKLDLKVLREQDLIKKLRLTTPRFGYVTAYRIRGDIDEVPEVRSVFVRGGKVKIELERDAPTLR